MDRSPSLRTTTDRPDRVSSSSNSTAFGSDVDDIMNNFSEYGRDNAGCSSAKWASAASNCTSPQSEGRRTSYGIPPPSSQTLVIPCDRPAAAPPQPVTPRVRPSSCGDGVCGSGKSTVALQLQKMQQMFYRLDSHNDGMEDVLLSLRSRLDTFRSLLATCLDGTVKELRSELTILRQSTQFLMQDFAGDFEQCRRIIVRRIQREMRGDVGDPLTMYCSKKDYCNDGRSTRNEEPWGSRQQRDAGRAVCSVFPGWKELEAQEDLLEAGQRCAALEKKLVRQRDAHEIHLNAMKDMYEQKEWTLKQRVQLLERLVERDSERLRYILSDDNKDSNDRGEEKNHFTRKHDSYNSSGGEDDDNGGTLTPKAQWRGDRHRKSTGNPCGRSVRGSDKWRPPCSAGSPMESWTPMLHDDVERRVRSQLLYGRRNSPHRNREREDGPEPIGLQRRRGRTSRQEARKLTNAAERLLNAVGEARPMRNRSMIKGDADNRQVGPWRTSNDVSTVARGLWAEKVLQRRSPRRF